MKSPGISVPAPHLAGTLRAMAKLYVMTDHGGSYPVHWQEPEPPEDTPERRWLLVAEVEDDQVAPVLDELHQKWKAL